MTLQDFINDGWEINGAKGEDVSFAINLPCFAVVEMQRSKNGIRENFKLKIPLGARLHSVEFNFPDIEDCRAWVEQNGKIDYYTMILPVHTADDLNEILKNDKQ